MPSFHDAAPQADPQATPSPAVPPGTPPRPATPPPRLSSHALLGGRHEVEIDHDGVVYRLRQTSLGKLILTK